MKISELKKLVPLFDKNLENAIDFSKRYSCRSNDIIILPIPVVPTSSVDIPDTVEITKLAENFNTHCDQAIVVCVGAGLSSNGDQYGTGLCHNIITPGNIVLMKIGRWENVVIHNHTVLYQINPGSIAAVENNINVFTSEEDKKKFVNELKASFLLLTKTTIKNEPQN